MKCPHCRAVRIRTKRTQQATDISTVRRHTCQECGWEWGSVARIEAADLVAAAQARIAARRRGIARASA